MHEECEDECNDKIQHTQHNPYHHNRRKIFPEHLAVLRDISVVEVGYPHIEDNVYHVCEVENCKINPIFAKSNHPLHVHVYKEHIERLYEQVQKKQQYEIKNEFPLHVLFITNLQKYAKKTGKI